MIRGWAGRCFLLLISKPGLKKVKLGNEGTGDGDFGAADSLRLLKNRPPEKITRSHLVLVRVS